MKRIFSALALAGAFLFASIPALAQNPARFDLPVITTTPSVVPIGSLPNLLAVTNATVSVCGYPATLSGGMCTNTITTYTDSTLASPCPSTAQLTAPGTGVCISTTGLQGSFGFWYNAATQTHMTYTVKTSWGTYGPYDIAPGSVSGGGQGTVTSVSSGNLAPLFTTSITNSTTTPAQSFTASAFAAHSFYGNNGGSTATPTVALIGASDWSPNSYVAGGGSAQAQTATLNPPVTALVPGLEVRWLPIAFNTATNPSLNVNGLGTRTITKLGYGLSPGDLTTASIADAIYDGTYWELQNPQTASSGSMVYPGAGIGVSTGSAWGTSIAPADVPLLDADQTFTGANIFTGSVNMTTGSFGVNAVAFTVNGSTLFNVAGAAEFQMAPTAAATSGANTDSTPSDYQGGYWNGTAAQRGGFYTQAIPASGSNPLITLTHTFVPIDTPTGSGTATGAESFGYPIFLPALMSEDCLGTNSSGQIVAGTCSGSLPTATAAGQAPISTAAGTTYTAQTVVTPTTLDNGSLPASFTTLAASGAISAGASPPTACGSASGCVALTDGSTAGTPTSGQAYIRADSTTGELLYSINGSSEANLAGGGSSLPYFLATGTTSIGASSLLGTFSGGIGLLQSVGANSTTSGNFTIEGESSTGAQLSVYMACVYGTGCTFGNPNFTPSVHLTGVSAGNNGYLDITDNGTVPPIPGTGIVRVTLPASLSGAYEIELPPSYPTTGNTFLSCTAADPAVCSWAAASGGSMVYPGAGIGVSTGTAWGTSLTAPTGTIVGTTDTQTLTNKTLDGVSPATMAFLDATSSIQTQLNGKQASGSYALTTATTLSDLTTVAGGTFGTAAFTAAPPADITITVGTTAVPANSCLPTASTYNTATMTGAASSMAATFGWSADYHAVTGWSPAGTTLYFTSYFSANTLNWQVCNNSAASITPSASTTWNVSAR